MQTETHGANQMSLDYFPGMIVRLATRPDWGRGRVQSAVGGRVTVNFEHAGKQVIDVTVVSLQIIEDDLPSPGP
jgi:FKBP-type peptidyl-prolyl cis-trans isomerase 2